MRSMIAESFGIEQSRWTRSCDGDGLSGATGKKALGIHVVLTTLAYLIAVAAAPSRMFGNARSDSRLVRYAEIGSSPGVMTMPIAAAISHVPKASSYDLLRSFCSVGQCI